MSEAASAELHERAASPPPTDATWWPPAALPPHRLYLVCLAALGMALAAAFLLAVGIGPKFIAPGRVFELLGARLSSTALSAEATADWYILAHIRLPRALLAVLVGGVLAVSGATMQGLFRNPLADPGLIGVSSGAAMAVTVVIVLGTAIFGADFSQLNRFVLPAAAFAGALTTTLLIYGIARRGGVTVVATLLLAGVAVGALAVSVIGLMVYLADDQQLRSIQFWGLGSLGGATWDGLLVSAPLLALCLILLPRWAHQLNSLLLGEDDALFLGTQVERLKIKLIVVVALGVGAAVAMTGGIGFVGLVVPHLIRMMLGPDHRYLMSCSILAGAILLLLADLAARTLHPPAEIPIGILTALLGAPVFLWLLLRRDGGFGDA